MRAGRQQDRSRLDLVIVLEFHGVAPIPWFEGDRPEGTGQARIELPRLGRGATMQPRLVEGWMAPNGSWISRTPARVLFNTRLSKQTIDGLHDIMRAAATYGWARGARVNERNANPGVAAKTGSAEWSEQRDAAHSWLIGYFPAEAPRIALALVVERGGLAPIVATRIARRVFASKAVADYVRSQG